MPLYVDKEMLMRKVLGALSIALLVGCGGGGEGGGSGDNRCEAFKVLNGGECTSDSLPVVQLEINSAGVCTGTIISNDHVLTAAHCVVGAQSVIARHDRGVQSATSARANPFYPADPLAFDVGVLEFPNIAKNFGVSPARILVSRRLSVGDRIRLVGYGDDGTPTLANGNPRGTELIVRGVVIGKVTTVFADVNSGACYGDSGGAITFDGRIVGTVQGGINFRTPGSCASGNINIFTDMQVSGNVDFVQQAAPGVIFE